MIFVAITTHNIPCQKPKKPIVATYSLRLNCLLRNETILTDLECTSELLTMEDLKREMEEQYNIPGAILRLPTQQSPVKGDKHPLNISPGDLIEVIQLSRRFYEKLSVVYTFLL